MDSQFMMDRGLSGLQEKKMVPKLIVEQSTHKNDLQVNSSVSSISDLSKFLYKGSRAGFMRSQLQP
jgi:hypothetical protein